MSEKVDKRIFVASAVFLIASMVFVFGLIVARNQIWPYQPIHSIWKAARSLVVFGELVPDGRRFSPPPGASREALTIHDPEQTGDGFYVFVGWDNERNLYAAWLYDSSGERRHSWPIDYLILDPDGPSNGADNPHAFQVLEDGSILVGFDKGDVMARLNSCGEPIWIKEGIYHHAMSPADDGSYWVWRGQGTAYGHYNYLENFSADTGETIQEFELVEDIIRPMDSSAVVFGVRPNYPFKNFERDPADIVADDLFHPNDIEALGADLAPVFPMFEIGDLLLSFRTLNLVAVVDPDDRRVKWWSQGPWIGQHDPDFTSDGKISVYNNNTGRGRSEIIKIDPGSGSVSNELFSGDVVFRSEYMGKHQYLPNGNILIVVPGEGRVLEVTANGEMVMEFNNLSSDSAEFNEIVNNGYWLQADYFQTFPDCPK
jgi:hypothetical protein